MRGDDSIEVVDTKQTDNSITKTIISGVDFDTAATIVKVYKHSDNKLKVDVGATNKFTSDYDIVSIDAIMFGGSLANCAWDSTEDCSVVGAKLNSGARYTDYIGGFNTVKINDASILWAVLSTKGNKLE